MSSKLSLEPEIEFFIDQNNAMSSHFLIENVQSNMIVKLECFSGHCHIAPVWMILYTQFWKVFFVFLEIPTLSFILTPHLLNFPRNSDPPFISYLKVRL